MMKTLPDLKDFEEVAALLSIRAEAVMNELREQHARAEALLAQSHEAVARSAQHRAQIRAIREARLH